MTRFMLAVLFCFFSCALTAAEANELSKAKADFALADKQLNEEYQKTREVLAKARFESLRDEQRDWLGYRDARSLAAVHYEDRSVPEGKEQTSPHYWQKMAELTRNRTEMVRAWREFRWDQPLTGRYADDYGGRILLLQEGDKLYFLIEVVRGPTYHYGGIAGVAQINAHMARYSDKDTDNDKKETWVTFLTGGQRIELMTANAQYYHGARAYFDGKYMRVADLTAKETKQVIKGDFDH